MAFEDLESVFDLVEAETPLPRVPAPQQQYVIWFTARSGSSWLKDVLTKARIGEPGEWLNPRFFRKHVLEEKSKSFDHFLRSILRRHTVNGIFGQEITPGFWKVFSQHADLDAYFDWTAPTVILYRKDIALQAVSLYLAKQSGYFHSIEKRRRNQLKIPYSREGILAELRHLAQKERFLRDFFAERDIKPRFAAYETLPFEDPARAASDFAQFLGVTEPEHGGIEPAYEKIATPRNDMFRDRFAEQEAGLLAEIEAGREWLHNGLRYRPVFPLSRRKGAARSA